MRTDETVSMPGYRALWEALPVKKCENKTFRGLNSGYVQVSQVIEFLLWRVYSIFIPILS